MTAPLLQVPWVGLAEAKKILDDFATANVKVFMFEELGQENVRENIWEALFYVLKDVSKKELHLGCLTAIRILSRDKRELDGAMTIDRTNVLLALAIPKNVVCKDYDVSCEALKCLCNIIYNSSSVSNRCSNNDCIQDVLVQLQTDKSLSPQIITYSLRILFVISAMHANARMRIKNDLDGINFVLELVSSVYWSFTTEFDYTSFKVDLICEALKLLFNLTINLQLTDQIEFPNVFILLRNLVDLEITNQNKKDELTSQVVNLLTTLPNEMFCYLVYSASEVNPQDEEMRMRAVAEILRLLKTQLDKTKGGNQNDMLSPVLTALLKASRGSRDIRKYIRNKILPPLTDVHNPPEEGETYRNYLCRLLTTPATNIRDLVADLIFVLCKENVNRMIKYTGYGNAAGMLAQSGLMGEINKGNGSNYSSDSEDSDTEEYKQHRHGINPVTGYFEPPRPNPTAMMTEEQKEYEAMKLVNLINDLNNMGIVKPCQIGEDGKPQPIDNVFQLQESFIKKHDMFDGEN